MLVDAIVIPFYNEINRINIAAFEESIICQKNTLFILVNDGSTDRTNEILTKIHTSAPQNTIVISLAKNVGKAEAIRLGFHVALKKTTIEYVGFLDADLSVDFSQYSEMRKKIMSSDKFLFYASRANGGGNITYSTTRLILSKFARFAIKHLISLPIEDTQCGAKIFNRDAAEICFQQPFVTKWLFDVEVFLRLKRTQPNSLLMKQIECYSLKKWKEVPNSHLRKFELLYMPVQILRIMHHYKSCPFNKF